MPHPRPPSPLFPIPLPPPSPHYPLPPLLPRFFPLPCLNSLLIVLLLKIIHLNLNNNKINNKINNNNRYYSRLLLKSTSKPLCS